jgi:hypothetical protein
MSPWQKIKHHYYFFIRDIPEKSGMMWKCLNNKQSFSGCTQTFLTTFIDTIHGWNKICGKENIRKTDCI